MKCGKSVRKHTLKRGTKAQPLCGWCKKRGHYRSNCPHLAQKLLQAAVQHSTVDALTKHVASGKPLKLNVHTRPQRTAKRAKGKRFHLPGKSAAAKKKQRTKGAKRRNKERQQMRKPKAKKQPLRKFTQKAVNSALKALKDTGWLWKKQPCSCGDRYVQVPLKQSNERGLGRVYLRCAGCRRWSDVLAFSFLPVVKMPLPLVHEAMTRYCHGPFPETLQSAASAMGLSGTSAGSALSKLWNALKVAEVRCMEQRQADRQLSGLLEVDATSVRKWRDVDTGRNVYYQIFGVYKRREQGSSDRTAPAYEATVVLPIGSAFM